MGDPNNKVLVVASREESRPVAHSLLAGLAESGYAPQLCCAQGDDDEKPIGAIVPEVILSNEVECDPLSGVVFLDDGGDATAAVGLAKRADAKDLAVAGYGDNGSAILGAAGLLKDKFVPSQLPGETTKGGKAVRTPAVRSDNIVTCVDGCLDGFVILVVDALGGEIRRTVTSEKEVVAFPINSCLVVSRMCRWPEYWSLAERLGRSGASLMLADWRDIDADKRVLSQHVLFCPRTGTVSLVKGACGLPKNVWFKQTSIGTNETISAVEALERAGCKNVNSSEAIRLATNKVRTAEVLSGICDQGSFEEFGDSNLDAAVTRLLEPGTRWVKPVDGSLGEKVMRVRGNGRTALLSKRIAESPTHVVVTSDYLRKTLVKSFSGKRFLIQDHLGSMRVGDTNFELRFLMRRIPGGWKASAELARGGILLSNTSNRFPVVCSAAQATGLAFGKEGKKKLQQARELALAACIVFQSALKSPDDVGELGVDITFSDAGPRVIEINSVPDLTFVEKAVLGGKNLDSVAKQAGAKAPDEPLSDEQMGASRGDIADLFSPDPHSRLLYRRMLELELGHQGIYPQHDGTVEIHYSHEKKKMPLEDALEMLQGDIEFYANKVKSLPQKETFHKYYAKVLTWAITRFRALRLFRKIVLASSSAKMRKEADYAFDFTGEESRDSYGSVPGPYSNIRVPTRVLQVREGDDWMEDLGALDPDMRSWLRRYLAAREMDPKATDCNKFILMDREHTPSPWSEYEHGEGHLPTRKQLVH